MKPERRCIVLDGPIPETTRREDGELSVRYSRKGMNMSKARFTALAAALVLLAATGCSCRKTEGSLQVNLYPVSAVEAGAQWRVDGGDWQDSGATVPGLSAGTHPVTFKDIAGWTSPEPQDALIAAEEARVLTAEYTEIPPSWHTVELPAGLGDVIPMDIDMPASGGGWIVGIELGSEKAAPRAVFEGEGLFEGEIEVPTPPATTGLVLRRTSTGWSKASLPELGANWGLYAASGHSAANGWTVGGDFTVPPLEVSLEGEGEDVSKALDGYDGTKEAPATPYGAVALRDPGTGILEGTTNANSYVLTAVAAVGSQDLWVATPMGLQRLTNGVWSDEVLPPDIETIQGLAFLGADDGWVVGGRTTPDGTAGAVLRRSAGAWTAAQLPALTVPWEVLGITALPGGEAWAVGQSTDETALTRTGVLLHCTGGAWQTVAPPAVSANWYLEAVSFPTVNEGWAAGTDLIAHAGIILHYKDGGWTVADLPVPGGGNWTLVGVSFATSADGWAVGYDNANEKMLVFQYGP